MGKNINNHRRSLRSAKIPKINGRAKTLARHTSTEKFISTVMKQKNPNLAEAWQNEGENENTKLSTNRKKSNAVRKRSRMVKL